MLKTSPDNQSLIAENKNAGVYKSLRFPSVLLIFLIVSRTILVIAIGFKPFDDAYITFRYALNLASGHGFVFNWNEHVLGTTSPLWTLILSVFLLLKLPIEACAMAIALFCDALTVWLITKLLFRLNFGPIATYAAAIIFITQVDYIALTISGMETCFYVFLLIATLYALSSERWIIAGCFCGLAILTRPEAVLLGSVFITFVIINALYNKRFTLKMWAGLGCFSIIVGSWGLFAKLYFGSFIPESVKAKAAAANEADLVNLSNSHILNFFVQGQTSYGFNLPTPLQLSFLVSGLALIGLLALLAALPNKALLGISRLLLLVAFPIIYTVVFALVHAFTWFPWYYGPIYLFLAILAGVGLETLAVSAAKIKKNLRKWLPIVVIVVWVLSQIAALILVKLPDNSHNQWVESLRASATTIPKDSKVSVAAFEIGVLGWTSYPVHVDDMAGLIDPTALKGSVISYLQAHQPDYIYARGGVIQLYDPKLLADYWFNTHYKLQTTVSDPYADTYFLFKKN